MFLLMLVSVMNLASPPVSIAPFRDAESCFRAAAKARESAKEVLSSDEAKEAGLALICFQAVAPTV